MVVQGETSGGPAGRQSSKTRVAAEAVFKAAVAVVAGVLAWHRHGPLIGLAVILLATLVLGGPVGYDRLRARGVFRSGVRNTLSTRTWRFVRHSVALPVLAAIQWCTLMATRSTPVLRETLDLVAFDTALVLLFVGLKPAMRVPWFARQAERIRARNRSSCLNRGRARDRLATGQETVPEPYDRW